MDVEAGLQALFENKVRTELAAADRLVAGADAVRASGDLFARVLLVKGLPGVTDRDKGWALAGPDGEAARKALSALGYDEESVFSTVSRPGGELSEASVRRLALQIDAIDPATVIALDREAADDLGAVAGISLDFGKGVLWRGREICAVNGLEDSLSDDGRKAEVWRQFRSLAKR